MRFPRIAAAAMTLVVIQLALVCSVAAKYVYQRWTCPRVWTRAASFDLARDMHARYLALQATVDGCQSTLPSARHAEFPRDYSGAAVSGNYTVRSGEDIAFPAELRVVNNRLTAIHIRDREPTIESQWVVAGPESPCDQMHLVRSVSFYLPNGVRERLQAAGSELWIEVTVPRIGPPRPIQLALKHNGFWEPLAFQ